MLWFQNIILFNDRIINPVDKSFEMPRREAVKTLMCTSELVSRLLAFFDFYNVYKELELARNLQFLAFKKPPQSFLMEEYIRGPTELLLQLTYRHEKVFTEPVAQAIVFIHLHATSPTTQWILEHLLHASGGPRPTPTAHQRILCCTPLVGRPHHTHAGPSTHASLSSCHPTIMAIKTDEKNKFGGTLGQKERRVKKNG